MKQVFVKNDHWRFLFEGHMQVTLSGFEVVSRVVFVSFCGLENRKLQCPGRGSRACHKGPRAVLEA